MTKVFLTPFQKKLILILQKWEYNSISITELGNMVCSNNLAIVQAMKSLETKGLTFRFRPKTEQQWQPGLCFTLTDKGRNFILPPDCPFDDANTAS